MQLRQLIISTSVTALRPVHLVYLPPAGNRKCSRGHVVGDAASRGHDGASADPHGSDQLNVRADQGVILDNGSIFGPAVEIAGNGSGSDGHVASDRGVPQIAQVSGAGSVPDGAAFYLDEIADAAIVSDPGTVPEMGARTDYISISDL
jgi:hypothetical protein